MYLENSEIEKQSNALSSVDYAPDYKFISNNSEAHPKHYCGVVLTGGAGRIREAFEILALKKIDRLIVSGVYKDAKLNEIFPHILYYPELNQEHIVLEKNSSSTLSNARESAHLARKMNCGAVLLITSQLHMSRAYKTFKYFFPAEFPILKFAVASSAKDNELTSRIFEIVKSSFYPILVQLSL